MFELDCPTFYNGFFVDMDNTNSLWKLLQFSEVHNHLLKMLYHAFSSNTEWFLLCLNLSGRDTIVNFYLDTISDLMEHSCKKKLLEINHPSIKCT